MKTKLGAPALLVSLTLTTLTGCSMTNANDSDDIPLAGTSTSGDAADATEAVSSEIYDLIGIKGKASETGAGVTECSDRDREKYFQIFHPWTFTPASAGDLDGDVMERLKEELPEHGWKVVDYGPDTSKNKNLTLTADNDEKKASVKIAFRATENPPSLRLTVVSGCYKIPDGEEIERF
ncbi:hypothetical protein [Streptomyces flaveus]|uniref:Lipoprotein n=1 Tax=Streptomyces flaveus TaxID=66370 RepID=A0A917VT84_9ACTN|nr:hypothetical protein [Streptomyces flaveus]GGL11932.1 hypothetical protein GCM10010094_86080 [Streptomyces flaveus]